MRRTWLDRRFCLGTLVLALATAASAEEVRPTELIRQRYREQLLAGPQPDSKTIEGYLARLKPDGSWPDVDYASRLPAGWPTAVHLSRVRELALAWRAPQHSLHGDERLGKGLALALDLWLAERFQSPSNWWWNEIGVPQIMSDILAVLDDALDPPRRAECLKVLEQYHLQGTGANLVWSAELALHHGCFVDQPEEVARATQRLWKEIGVGGEEGIQPDYSFFQHGRRLQAFQYGRKYLEFAVSVASQVRDTPWQIPPERRNVLSAFLLEGLQWMCRGTATVPATVDRAVSRKEGLGPVDLRATLDQWQQVDPTRAAELSAFAARQAGNGEPLVGFRHFPHADFSAYHCPTASVFLKTISTRTLGTESINGENLKGVSYLGYSDLMILRDGAEYDGLPPVWDWPFLPGLTGAEGRRWQRRMPFVGGLGDGHSGLAAMDYLRSDRKNDLKVRKLWAFHEGLVVCLLGGWDVPDAPDAICTAVEQCRLRESAQVALPDGVATLHEGELVADPVAWVLHHGIGYLPLQGTPLHVQLRRQRGNWHAINDQYPSETVAAPVLSIVLDHGRAPQPGGYVLVLDANAERLEELRKTPPWEVLQNTADCQCLRFRGGLTLAAFFAPAEAGGVCVSEPCLALWSTERLRLCDPTHEGKQLTVTWNGQVQQVDLPRHAGVVELANPSPAHKRS